MEIYQCYQVYIRYLLPILDGAIIDTISPAHDCIFYDLI